ncbi:acyltransferase family protein [Palleronia rufa]|uniref:acyltransferase family protein n=1 Tax=Palleronia rufa TaxID=1530186 RepID=UPI001376AA2E|nr:acyltransferase [Palleronia rufa]
MDPEQPVPRAPAPAPRSVRRVPALDGLRGLAILMVVRYHAYARWSGMEPFAQPRWLAPLGLGWMGVQLFFAISGYVIAMSLGRGGGVAGFARRRWLRLFPAMALASLAIYATAPLLPARPAGMPRPLDLLPGLTLLSPEILSRFLPAAPRSLDGAFWSIYVEVGFYAVAALAYPGLGDRRLRLVAVLYIGFLALALAARATPLVEPPLALLRNFGVQHYGWFLLGIGAWETARTGCRGPLRAGLAFAALAALDMAGRGDAAAVLVTAAALAALFLAAVRGTRALEHRALLWLGWIAYPLYLVHQNITTGLAIALARAFPGLPPPLYPVPGLALSLALAVAIAGAESRLRRVLSHVLPALKPPRPAR